MLRKLGLALGIVVALAPLSSTAEPVPAGINLHNGYIEVFNQVTLLKGAVGGERVQLRGPLNAHYVLDIPEKGTASFNHCCILAGTQYEFYTSNRFGYHKIDFVPRLCNLRGIPFGYAAFAVRGTISYEGLSGFKQSPTDVFHIARIDTGCPS